MNEVTAEQLKLIADQIKAAAAVADYIDEEEITTISILDGLAGAGYQLTEITGEDNIPGLAMMGLLFKN